MLASAVAAAVKLQSSWGGGYGAVDRWKFAARPVVSAAMGFTCMCCSQPLPCVQHWPKQPLLLWQQLRPGWCGLGELHTTCMLVLAAGGRCQLSAACAPQVEMYNTQPGALQPTTPTYRLTHRGMTGAGLDGLVGLRCWMKRSSALSYPQHGARCHIGIMQAGNGACLLQAAWARWPLQAAPGMDRPCDVG